MPHIDLEEFRAGCESCGELATGALAEASEVRQGETASLNRALRELANKQAEGQVTEAAPCARAPGTGGSVAVATGRRVCDAALG